MFLYTILNLMISLTVRISGGRLEPDNYDMKEYWSWKGSGKAPWFVRLARKKGCFGGEKAEEETDKRDFAINEENDSSCGEASRVGSSDRNSDQKDEIAVVSSPDVPSAPFSKH